jgi:phage FluMu protein Com
MSVWHDYADEVATIRCAQCNHVLGVVEPSGAVVSRSRGRETVIDPADALVRIRCERCGHTTNRRANVARHGPTDVERR